MIMMYCSSVGVNGNSVYAFKLLIKKIIALIVIVFLTLLSSTRSMAFYHFIVEERQNLVTL